MKNHFLISLLFLLALPSTTQAKADPLAWNDIHAYQRGIVNELLPHPGEQWDQETAFDFVRRHGTRSSTYLCVGMLLRDRQNDRDHAQRILDELLKLQIRKPDHKTHGIWWGGMEKKRIDQNWREFVGVGMIVIREYFRGKIDPKLVQGIDIGLRKAAEGASRRDVSPYYTNIALMSAFLLNYVGHFTEQEWIDQGIRKARDVYAIYQEHNTFPEYNSPTYYGVNLMGIALWREVGLSPEFRKWGEKLEKAVWREVGQVYHADFKNLCGPYYRAYGMDMTEYTALQGLQIAFALNDPKRAPVPKSTQNRSFEWAYAPMYSILGVNVPQDAMIHLKSFQQKRHLRRQAARRNETLKITAHLEKQWMVGASTGMDRRWEQHCPATLHWRMPNGRLAWLLVHGESGGEVKYDRGKMQIFIPHPDSAHPLKLLVHLAGLPLPAVKTKRWNLPGMQLNIETNLEGPAIAETVDNKFGPVTRITWDVPDDLATKKPALILTPRIQSK
ncbi:hypothetical protein GF373_15070 [bacterium]|nr:hypothetical protein [bacterium]